MASAGEIARRYFAALSAHDLDAAAACWAPGGQGRFVGSLRLGAPEGVRDYFGRLFEAFPDFELEILDLTTARTRTAVRWRARGTFAGPGSFEGFSPTGARVEVEGCDVVTVRDDLIQSNDAYVDFAALARQLGVLPAAGSAAERRLQRATNLRTRLSGLMRAGEPEWVADGVWVLRGWSPRRIMNVYLLADDGGVTLFDAGVRSMAPALAAAGARMGGIKRVVLSHADPDHRGAAPGLGSPVHCHEAERGAAESPGPLRSYWDLSRLDPHGRLVLGRLLPIWDGGPVEVEGTLAEGEEVAGFRVIELPGHAPGQIGLIRESDRLALVSDCLYTLDVQTGIRGRPRLPHVAFDADVEQARASIRKLAGLEPSAVWTGHADPITADVSAQLLAAAG